MQTRGHRRPFECQPTTDDPARAASVRRGPGTSTVHPLASSLLELQHLAGNRAVAAEIGSRRNGRVVIGASSVDIKTHPSGPPDGVRKIAESRGYEGGLLGRTLASIDPSPPLLRAEAPVKVDHGWTAQARAARVPEPYLESWWPTAGRHEQYPHVYLEISDEWEGKVKAGEEEHISDTTVAWQVTWAKVHEVIGALAASPGTVQSTEEAARHDLWKRFKAALPDDLRPGGVEPNDDAQQAVWGFDDKTNLFNQLFRATKVRDDLKWHTTSGELDHLSGKDEIRVVKGDVQIGVKSSEDLIAEKRATVRRR